MIRLFYLGILVILISCRPSERIDIADEVQLPYEGSFDDIVFFDENRGLAVGGDTWQTGYMAYTLDGGITWEIDTVKDKRIFAVDTMDGHFLAGGIDGYLFDGQLTMQGLDWTYTRQRYWYIIQDIAFDPSGDKAVVIGGNRFGFGFCERLGLTDAIIADTISKYENMIEGVASPENDVFVAVGFGVYLYSDNGGIDWTEYYQEGHLFKAVDFRNKEKGLMCTYKGDIFRTEDGGKSWTEVKGTGGLLNRSLLTELRFDSNGTVWVCGERASLFYSEDFGSSWTKIKVNTDEDFTSLALQGENIWLTTTNGKLLRVPKP